MSTSTLRIPRRSSGPRDEDSATNTGPGRSSYAPVVLSMAADAGEMSERTLQSRHSGVFSRLNFKKESSDIDVELVDLEVNESRRTTDRTPNELPGGQRVSWNKGKKPFPSAASPILDDGASDFERALRDVMEKSHQSGIQRRELGVMFENLKVIGAGSSTTYQPTLGSILNPLNLIELIQSIRHPATREILSGFDGVVRPGEMLLVLGRPGAGCSTLLRTLANDRGCYHAVQGDVHYDSLSPKVIDEYCRGDVQYCPEDDVHFPSLTVDQTLTFAATMRASHKRIEGVSRDAYARWTTDVLECVFGLSHAKDTVVGDASIRGISGGEKKRVSICETLAARGLLTCWDNSTRGLDSSTALEFVQAIRTLTDVAHVSTVVSIYQVGEPLYELFDKVCVIYEGKMAYFGPANRAKQYFIDMGYEPAHRQTTADFLVAVTDPHGRTPHPDCQSPVPRTATEFVEYYRKSGTFRANNADMESYRKEFVGKPDRANAYLESVRAEHTSNTRSRSSYITSISMQIRALMVRRAQIIRGAMTAFLVEMSTFIILALIAGTAYLRLKRNTDSFFSRASVIFFAYIWSGLSTMSEIPTLFTHRPITLRQSRATMYHPFVEALALTLVDIPISLVTMVLFSVILYFLADLQESARQFFIFMLFVSTMTITLKAFFRALTAAFQDPAPALAASGISMLILVLYTGYPIPVSSMIKALSWITYINPLKYGFEALVVNEFSTLNGTCSMLIPSGLGYKNVSLLNQACVTVGALPGQASVSGTLYMKYQYSFHYKNLWPNFGIVCGFGLAFIGLLIFLTEINTEFAREISIVLFRRGSRSNSPAVMETEVEKSEPQSPISASAETDSRNLSHNPIKGNIFSWHHLRYAVPVGGGQSKQLLNDVSGYVAPGKLTALMGESGAGKTTLLNVLAERTGLGIVTGDRFMNGQALPPDFQAQTGYCQQMDTHVPFTTVREALLFSAKLRQPQSVPLAEKEAYVDECLHMCGLAPYAEAIVGTLGSEQLKRTTVGVELVAKPSLIFLDEPTSGLDSQSAWAIMSFLRSLADNGLSIVCTIHQPSAELFEVFDRLLLLQKGGETVYFGDLGHKSSTVIDYFERNGSRPCNEIENPAEFILEVIGAGATATSEIDWSPVWQRSKEAYDLLQELESINSTGRTHPPIKVAQLHEFATSWRYQLVALLQRDFRSLWRDPIYLVAKMMINICCALVIGFTYFKTKSTVQGTRNQLFSIYISMFLAAPVVESLQVPFLAIRDIYEIRERHSRIYSWTAMLTSQFLAEIPWNILGSTLFLACWYWTAGFPSGRAGYTFLLFGVIYPLYYTSFGQATAAMSPNSEVAALVFNALFAIMIMFAGVLEPLRELGWWRWMNRVSPATYFIEGFLGQAVGRQQISCTPVQFIKINPPSGQSCSQYMEPYISLYGGYLTDQDAISNCMYCLYRTTDQYLKTLNIFYDNHWKDLGIFCIYTALNVVGIYIFMYLCRIRAGTCVEWLRARFVARWRYFRQLSTVHT
ncbi:hypothetical protein AcV7_005930 [Taiwanofungus camphoratus]|nr:hypothetical protein AcV7_005930 [Antrodia cinnamomea]